MDNRLGPGSGPLALNLARRSGPHQRRTQAESTPGPRASSRTGRPGQTRGLRRPSRRQAFVRVRLPRTRDAVAWPSGPVDGVAVGPGSTVAVGPGRIRRRALSALEGSLNPSPPRALQGGPRGQMLHAPDSDLGSLGLGSRAWRPR